MAAALCESGDYPGNGTPVSAILRMADRYRADALALLAPGRRGDPVAAAPGRLLALQAIELYLNAWLRVAGETGRQIRSRQHDLAGRAQAALASGLGLRRRTASHLARLTADREYLRVRYAPDELGALSQLNRLTATLDEVARKVRAAAARPAPASAPAPRPRVAITAGAPLLPPWQAPATPSGAAGATR